MKYAIVAPNVYANFALQPSAAALILQFKAQFEAAGWSSSSISGGYQFSTTSPQGFTVKVNITDLGDPHVGVQMVGTVNGYLHKLAWERTLANNIPPYNYQIVVNPCGFFISRTAVASDPDGSAVCGGIPYVANNCGIGGAPTELWYSFGDYGQSPFFANMNPRLGIDVGSLSGFLFGSQEACLNGHLYSFNDWSAPQILRFSTEQTGSGVSIWADGVDIIYEPILAFPLADRGDLQMRGQIYNAVLRSSAHGMDQILTFDGYDWINYTNNYAYGGLWLMKSKALATANYAY